MINKEKYEHFIIIDKINEIKNSDNLKINDFILTIINDKCIIDENDIEKISEVKNKIDFINNVKNTLNSYIITNAKIFKKNKEIDSLYLSLVNLYEERAKELDIYNILSNDFNEYKKCIETPELFVFNNQDKKYIKIKKYLSTYLYNKSFSKSELIKHLVITLNTGYTKTYEIINQLIEEKFILCKKGFKNNKYAITLSNL